MNDSVLCNRENQVLLFVILICSHFPGSNLVSRVVPIDLWYSCKDLLSSGDYIFCFAMQPGACKEAKACRAGSHNLHKLNDMNAEENPSPAVT